MKRTALIVGQVSGHPSSNDKTIGLSELNKLLGEGYVIEAVHQLSSAAAGSGGGGAVAALLGCLVILVND